MRKSVLGGIAVVGVLIIFAIGFLIGQVRGTTSSSAQAPANSSTNGRTDNGGTNNGGFGHGFGRGSDDGRGFGPGGFAAGPHLHGTVKSIDGNTLTITITADPGGDSANAGTIVLTSKTQYMSPMGGTSTGKSAIKAGTNIIASGILHSDGGTMTATRIAILPDGATGPGSGPPGGQGFGPGASGQVTALNGNTITIKPAVAMGGMPSSSITKVIVTGSTTYVTATGASSSKSTIKPGTLITAQGTLSSDGKTLTATTIRIATAFSSGSTT